MIFVIGAYVLQYNEELPRWYTEQVKQTSEANRTLMKSTNLNFLLLLLPMIRNIPSLVFNQFSCTHLCTPKLIWITTIKKETSVDLTADQLAIHKDRIL